MSHCIHILSCVFPTNKDILPLLWVELYPLKIHMSESQLPGPQKVTVFGDGVLKDVIKLKWSRIGGQPWSSKTGKKRRLFYIRKPVWRHWKKMEFYKPRREAAEGTSSDGTVISDFQSQGLWEIKLLLFKPFSLWHFAMAAQENDYILTTTKHNPHTTATRIRKWTQAHYHHLILRLLLSSACCSNTACYNETV